MKAADLIDIIEMSNAIQKYTGLPGNLYFSTRDEVTNKQAHSFGRVKHIHAGSEATCSIKVNPKTGERVKEGKDERQVKRLEEFVELNEDVLWEHWNTPMADADSVETTMKFKKLK
jgi:hypothetical protein